MKEWTRLIGSRISLLPKNGPSHENTRGKIIFLPFDPHFFVEQKSETKHESKSADKQISIYFRFWEKMSVVGIDFGNKNAVIAAAGRGGVDVILNGNSNRLNA